ncbi:hypothetical protein ONZ45_g13517 [Pleurotus djamor]|nr:hypothetical protein ONZ45_g13517 [Pleurotus djamor]
MMLTIPDEILEMMIKPLGNPDRNLLLPLRLVSRRFYGFTLPMLYESISAAFSDRYFITGPNFPFLTTVVPERFSVLYQSLHRKPSLATHITTIISHGRISHTDSDWKSFQSVLATAIGLRRLSIFAGFSHTPSIEFVPPGVQLTHLTLPNLWDETTYEFIRCHPSLEYLKLGPISYGKEVLASTFPAITLPNLRILDCDATFLNKLELNSSVEHFDFSLGGYTPPRGPGPLTIPKIRSFKGDTPSWRHFAHSCELLEYVWVTTVSDVNIEYTLAACSSKIKYLFYADDESECALLFDKFPELVVIDFDRGEFGCFRYFRGVPEPEEINVPRLEKDEFRHWHELVVDVVEEEAQKNRCEVSALSNSGIFDGRKGTIHYLDLPMTAHMYQGHTQMYK